MRNTTLSSLVFLLLAGCAPTLEANPVDGSTRRDAGTFTGEGIPPQTGAFTHDVEDGLVDTVVDATSTSDWRHLDLDTGRSVDVSDSWDLAFSRFRVRINGGVTGTGNVQVAALDGASYESVTQAPEEGWTVPVPDGEEDDDTEPDNVFNNGSSDWYDYAIETHTLTPRDVTYVVATTDRRFFKLRFESYYDDSGSPAIVRFRWAAVAPPDSELPDAGPGGPPDAGMGMPDAGGGDLVPGDAIEIVAGDGTTWTYISVTDGVVTPTQPEDDASWDIAFRRTAARTNSGTSGTGVAGARIVEDADFDDIDAAETFGFAEDEVLNSGIPGAVDESLNASLSNWYDYNPTTHSVTPSDQSYLIRTAEGAYARMRIWTWADGLYQMSFHPVPRRVETRTVTIDVSESPQYLSVRLGAALESVEDPETSDAWDLQLSAEAIRTNGGVSGPGEAGVVASAAETMTALTEAPSEGYAVDVAAGSEALNDWHAGDGSTSRDVVYVLRLADGTYGALRVVSFADGVYTLELAYAGPGYTSFGDR